MKTMQQVECLFADLYEEEVPSWPYLVQTETGDQLALFTIYMDENPETGLDDVFGYGRECRLEGGEIVSEEKEVFEAEEETIVLRDVRELTCVERDELLA